MQLYKYLDLLYVRQKNDIFPEHICFTLEFLLPTNYPRESATSFCSPHLPTWVESTHGLWVCGFKKDTSIAVFRGLSRLVWPWRPSDPGMSGLRRQSPASAPCSGRWRRHDTARRPTAGPRSSVSRCSWTGTAASCGRTAAAGRLLAPPPHSSCSRRDSSCSWCSVHRRLPFVTEVSDPCLLWSGLSGAVVWLSGVVQNDVV